MSDAILPECPSAFDFAKAFRESTCGKEIPNPASDPTCRKLRRETPWQVREIPGRRFSTIALLQLAGRRGR
jgi:hypothetical protein